MEWAMQAVQFVLHLDRHIDALWAQYGTGLYVLMFAIVFAETGFVVTPWLPGDSLLFVLGALAAAGGPPVGVLMLVLFVAAVLGNTSNYWIGRWIGPRLFREGRSRWLSKDALDKTHAFFAKHGPKAVTLSRFVPLVRTFAPFVAGLGAMPHGKFQLYSIVGGAAWVLLMVGAGFFFGTLPVVKNNLPLVMIGVVIVSFVPLAIETVRR